MKISYARDASKRRRVDLTHSGAPGERPVCARSRRLESTLTSHCRSRSVCRSRAESDPYRSRLGTGVCAKTAIRLRARNSLHRPLRDIPNRKVTHLPRGTIRQLIHPPTASRGPLPSRVHRAEAKVHRDLADLAARFEEVNAETIVEIRALRNEITHMHMIDATITTERDETLWLN
jgi:hypothetical protein